MKLALLLLTAAALTSCGLTASQLFTLGENVALRELPLVVGEARTYAKNPVKITP